MEEFYTIGQKIKAARRAIGYTQKDLAQKTGYTLALVLLRNVKIACFQGFSGSCFHVV